MSVHLSSLNAHERTEVVGLRPGEVNPLSPEGEPETAASILFFDGEDAVVLEGTPDEISGVLARAAIALNRLR